MQQKPHNFLNGILSIAETALWTFLIIILLIFVFILTIGLMLYLLPRYPQIPDSWVWPVVWTTMGVLISSLGVLYFWWGSVLKDREKLNDILEATHP